ncbi:hypothetical protein KI387_016393, partial [Taxus chinensis]
MQFISFQYIKTLFGRLVSIHPDHEKETEEIQKCSRNLSNSLSSVTQSLDKQVLDHYEKQNELTNDLSVSANYGIAYAKQKGRSFPKHNGTNQGFHKSSREKFPKLSMLDRVPVSKPAYSAELSNLKDGCCITVESNPGTITKCSTVISGHLIPQKAKKYESPYYGPNPLNFEPAEEDFQLQLALTLGVSEEASTLHNRCTFSNKGGSDTKTSMSIVESSAYRYWVMADSVGLHCRLVRGILSSNRERETFVIIKCENN